MDFNELAKEQLSCVVLADGRDITTEVNEMLAMGWSLITNQLDDTPEAVGVILSKTIGTCEVDIYSDDETAGPAADDPPVVFRWSTEVLPPAESFLVNALTISERLRTPLDALEDLFARSRSGEVFLPGLGLSPKQFSDALILSELAASKQLQEYGPFQTKDGLKDEWRESQPGLAARCADAAVAAEDLNIHAESTNGREGR
jgi:hypothetical protein